MSKSILYLVRTEADYERAICLAITGKELGYKQSFVFAGDFTPFYEEGLKNDFQKYLFEIHGFSILNIVEFSSYGRILLKLSNKSSPTLDAVVRNPRFALNWVFYKLIMRQLSKNKFKIVNKCLSKIKPDLLLTDQSSEDEDYLPEILRAEAFKRGVKVFIFPHGAAGGLHYHFSNPQYGEYANYTVLASNDLEASKHPENRIVTGDFSSGYTYVKYMNSIDYGEIYFLNDRPFRVAFMIGGTIQSWTSTNAWCIQEEIIINLSERPDVAMVLKLHPRESEYLDLRMLKTFKNLLIVKSETDRSRVSKWANIVVCNDHTSVIFEPMILGKKVFGIEGVHTPRYKMTNSPLHNSSIVIIRTANGFQLESARVADPMDDVTNWVAWGGRGPNDLAKMVFEDIV